MSHAFRDYSLIGVPNRLAEDGENLRVHRFTTGSVGLAEFRASKDGVPSSFVVFWTAIRDFFGFSDPRLQPLAVCIPPGARLLVQDIPKDLQRQFTTGPIPIEEVTFTQLSAMPNTHRDAIRFSNSEEILLQQLHEGQRVHLLQVSIPEEFISRELDRGFC